MHGTGILKSKDSTFKGDFVNGLRHGKGVEIFNNGDWFEGIFQNGRFHGFGTYFWKKDKAIYTGGFKNGFRHGKGKYQSNTTTFEGSYI